LLWFGTPVFCTLGRPPNWLRINMKNLRATGLLLGLSISLSFAAGCQTWPEAPDYSRPLPINAQALLALEPGESRPDLRATFQERRSVKEPLQRSLDWTRRDSSRKFFPIAGITHDRAVRSLERFKELIESSTSHSEFQAAIEREFDFYKSAGWDGAGGGVLFTGYYTPTLAGSREQTTTFRYPLYALPADLVKGHEGEILGQQTEAGVRPYPTRRAIEAGGLLRGQNLELVWLSDPLDAYIAHVNGSAVVELRDGSEFRLGYAGKNGRPYSSLGQALVADGRLDADKVSMPNLRDWMDRNPELAQAYLGRNESYVFFTPIDGDPRGSLNLEVVAERSLATDKSLFPRGALVFVDATVPSRSGRPAPYRKLMFDQDTGGAIRTAGRADIYLGVGDDAELRAGSTRSVGQMTYMFLAE